MAVSLIKKRIEHGIIPIGCRSTLISGVISFPIAIIP